MGVRLGIAVLLLTAGVATGDRAALSYDAPVDCPDERAFRAFVAARLGVDPFDDTGSSHVSILLTRSGPYHATVSHVAGDGPVRQRSFSAETCPELVQSLAVSMAVVLDPVVRRATPAPPPPLVEEPSPEPVAARATSIAEPPAPFRVGVGVGVAWGLSIGAAPMFRIEGRAVFDWWSVAVEARGVTGVPGVVAGVGLSTLVFEGAAVPCLHWRWLAGCAEVAAGGLSAVASGIAQARGGWAPFVSVGGRLSLQHLVSDRVGLLVLGELRAPLFRVFASVATPTGLERVWQTSPIGGGVSAMAYILL
ncbi:MAG: hypothetical protein IAE78_06140 [Myxococcus sp.]|nr:hypothetical protein [Myxococcus sp.]